MTKQEILAKVNELIAAPTCNPELKKSAEAYMKAQDKKTADELVAALETYVNSIDETIAFAESDLGKKLFGAEAAENTAKLGRKVKAEGGKYCFCPACQPGSVIYENKELLY